MKMTTKQGLIMGTILYYGGKALIALGACFLPWPYACVAWGWLIANTGMTMAINAKGFEYRDNIKAILESVHSLIDVLETSDFTCSDVLKFALDVYHAIVLNPGLR